MTKMFFIMFHFHLLKSMVMFTNARDIYQICKNVFEMTY